MIIITIEAEDPEILSSLGTKASLDNEYSSFKMNQRCRVCGEKAAGFHFGAFTCEGCKSFFGRTCNNLSQMDGCKNGSKCVINRKTRTACKACRLRKCLRVGMSKGGSRYGRRSNWFKIHCLIENQKGGSSDEIHDDEEEASSERTVSTPSSMKSVPLSSPRIWNPSMSPASSPSSLKEEKHDNHSTAQSHLPFMNPFFNGNPFLGSSGFHPMTHLFPINQDVLQEFQQHHPDLLRWYLSCQPQLLNQPLPKMPFAVSPVPEKRATGPSPVPSCRSYSASPSGDDNDQPLDLSAKKLSGSKFGSVPRRFDYGTTPASPSGSEGDDEDEQEDVEEHFRRSGMILDLSRK